MKKLNWAQITNRRMASNILKWTNVLSAFKLLATKKIIELFSCPKTSIFAQNFRAA
jgi:hypothetical protein